jgi:hypothetical protein
VAGAASSQIERKVQVELVDMLLKGLKDDARLDDRRSIDAIDGFDFVHELHRKNDFAA